MSLGAIVNDSLLHKYQTQNDQYRQELASIADKLNKHTRLIDECLSVRGIVEEVRAFIEEQKKQNETLANSQKINDFSLIGTLRIKDQHERELDSLKKELTIVKELINTLATNLSTQTKKLETLPFERKLEAHQKGQAAVNADIYQQIGKTRADLVVSPAQIISSNNDLLKKIESALLDGANSANKVNNFELQIRVLEKKIESLGIQLKKLELGQQLA